VLSPSEVEVDGHPQPLVAVISAFATGRNGHEMSQTGWFDRIEAVQSQCDKIM
jgi:hypothetical protein